MSDVKEMVVDWEDLDIGELKNDNEGFDTEPDNEGTGAEEEAQFSEADETDDTEEAKGSADSGAEHDVEEVDEGSREAKRIAELASALKRQDLEHRKTMAELKARDATRERENQLSLRETGLAAQKSSLESRLKEAELAYRNAREDSNTAAELKAIKDLQALELQSLAIKGDLEAIQSAREELKTKPVQVETQTEANPKALAWLERNSWVQGAKPYVQSLVAAQAEALLDKGIDPNSDAFYDKLDANVNALVKANEWDYSVNFRTKPKGADKKADMEKGTTKARAKSNQPSSEKGSGDGPIVGKTSEGKTKVKVTPDDKEMAKNLGIEIMGKDGKYSPRFQAYMRERVKTDAIFSNKDKSLGPQWSDV